MRCNDNAQLGNFPRLEESVVSERDVLTGR